MATCPLSRPFWSFHRGRIAQSAVAMTPSMWTIDTLRADAIYRLINKAKMTNHYGSHKKYTGRYSSLHFQAQWLLTSIPGLHPWALDGVAPLDLSAGTAMNYYGTPQILGRADALYLPFKQITGNRPNRPHGF